MKDKEIDLKFEAISLMSIGLILLIPLVYINVIKDFGMLGTLPFYILGMISLIFATFKLATLKLYKISKISPSHKKVKKVPSVRVNTTHK